jgi:hypothetical protein
MDRRATAGLVLLGLVSALTIPSVGAAQEAPARWAWRTSAPAPFTQPPQAINGAGGAGVALRSLLVPGAGEWTLGRHRAWFFAAAEIASWAWYLDRRRGGNHFRTAYRDLAWDRGRTRAAPRVEGDFNYYETLSKWTRSGAFDADPLTPGTQPEPDESTYNGTQWRLARGIFLQGGEGTPGDPAYARALEYYRDRAYDEEFLWDWSADPSAREDFKKLIRKSDDRFRQATTALGVVIANHVISAIDAFVLGRASADAARIELVPGRPQARSGWTATIRLGVGR